MAVGKNPKERTRMLMSNPPIKVVERMINGQWVEISRTRMPKAQGPVPAPNFTPGSGQNGLKPMAGTTRRSATKSVSKSNGQSSSGYGTKDSRPSAAKSKTTSSMRGQYVKKGR